MWDALGYYENACLAYPFHLTTHVFEGELGLTDKNSALYRGEKNFPLKLLNGGGGGRGVFVCFFIF